MTNEEPPDNKTDEELLQGFFNQWVAALSNIAIAGEPFFKEGIFESRFSTEYEIFKISITREPNNIIEFPKKEVKPKRI